jgi:shikimate 5-dehydrogenase
MEKQQKNFFHGLGQFSNKRFDGTGMLIAQAAFSFQLWFDTFPDISNINLSKVND